MPVIKKTSNPFSAGHGIPCAVVTVEKVSIQYFSIIFAKNNFTVMIYKGFIPYNLFFLKIPVF